MATESFLWAGLDAGGTTSRLTIIDDRHEPVYDATLQSEPELLLKALRSVEPRTVLNVAVEASSVAHRLVRDLRAAGVPIQLYDVTQTSRYLRTRRNKTDINDARGLAEIAKLQLRSISSVRLKATDTQLLRSKLVLRHRLNLQRVACEAAMRAQLVMQLGPVGSFNSNSAMKASVHNALAELASRHNIEMGDVILPLLEICLRLRRSVDHLEYTLAKAANANLVCSRFLAVPGIGPICAISFFTAIEDAERFADSASVGAYLGLTPRVMQSGESLRHGRISRMGNALTRSHLAVAATALMAPKAPETALKRWGLGLATRVGRGKAKLAVARRLAVILLAMWKSGTPWDPALVEPRVRC